MSEPDEPPPAPDVDPPARPDAVGPHAPDSRELNDKIVSVRREKDATSEAQDFARAARLRLIALAVLLPWVSVLTVLGAQTLAGTDGPDGQHVLVAGGAITTLRPGLVLAERRKTDLTLGCNAPCTRCDFIVHEQGPSEETETQAANRRSLVVDALPSDRVVDAKLAAVTEAC